MSVRQPELLAYYLFDHPTITGEKVSRKTIAASDETANYSSEFKYDQFFQNTLGIIGLAMKFDGDASDTITVVLEYKYGDDLDWTTSATTVTLHSAVAGNVGFKFIRLDIEEGWRDNLPFEKLRFKITKTGTNGACVITSRIVRV